MGVPGLGSTLQDSIEFERGEFVDVDVRVVTFLGHSEVLSAWVNGDRAHTIAVFAVERHILLCLQVIGLVLVTGYKDDCSWRQEVDIVTFHGRQTEDCMEGEVSTGDLRIWQCFRNVTVRIKLIDTLLIRSPLSLLLSRLLAR